MWRCLGFRGFGGFGFKGSTFRVEGLRVSRALGRRFRIVVWGSSGLGSGSNTAHVRCRSDMRELLKSRVPFGDLGMGSRTIPWDLK